MDENLATAAQLAQAAYSQLNAGQNDDALAAALISQASSGFVATQAQTFAATQTVLLQYNDDAANASGNNTSLSLTVFRRNDGQLTLAIRGTAESGDWVPTDTSIFGMGAGYDQIAALYNWWMRVSSVGSEPVAQYRVRSVSASEAISSANLLPLHAAPFSGGQVMVLERIADAVPTGELVSALIADSDYQLDVTGHSLGGHLAMAFAALFPSNTASVTSFNAPGFIDSPINQTFFGRLGGVVPTQSSIGDITTNVVANHAGTGDVGWQGIAMLHSRPGIAVDVPIEEQFLASGEPVKPAARNHSQMVLTDALAVYRLVEQLSGEVPSAKFADLLGVAAHYKYAELEGLVGVIAASLGVRTAPLPSGHDQREVLYATMKGIATFVADKGLNGQISLDIASESTRANARLEFGDFLALYNLGPFVLNGKHAAAQATLNASWQQAHDNLYLAWYSDKNATLSGNAAHEYAFSDQWFNDRSAMLAIILERNRKDIDGIVPGKQNLFYRDVSSGNDVVVGAGATIDQRIQVFFGGGATDNFSGKGFADRLYGGEGNDFLSGLGGADYIEGNSGNDHLNGGEGKDTLLGGAGADVLRGGGNGDLLMGNEGNDELHGEAGNDTLKGGDGTDTYVIDGSVGNDIVIDEGGGIVRYKNHVLSVAKRPNPGATEWKDEHATYRVVAEGQKQNLVISAGAGTLTLMDWVEGKFGIQLDEAEEPPEPPNPDISVHGDKAPVDTNAEAEGVQVSYDALGNVIVKANQAAPDRIDLLYDSLGNDELFGHGGNDTLNAYRGGDDLLDGGAGDDYLLSGLGGDTLAGGNGLDRLWGQGGDDRLFADLVQEDAHVQTDHDPNSEDKNGVASKGDLLAGGEGADWTVGWRRADLLLGGDAKDTLWGGAGNDVLYGDSNAGSAQSDWTLQRTVTHSAETDIVTYQVDFTGVTYVEASVAGDSDVMYGGAGDDWMFGELGQDQLFGGSGEDVLFGGGDSDWIDGGEGNDAISGDEGVQTDASYGHDFISGGTGNDSIHGDGGHDVIFGGDDNDELVGDGRDINVTYQGDDYLDGGRGDDTLRGYAGEDTLLGGEDDDLLIGDVAEQYLAGQHHGADLLDGGTGNDTLFGSGGADSLFGDEGSDFLVGDAAQADLTGVHHGDDALDGGEGEDTLLGSGGSDTLLGGAGNDYLEGDDDLDQLPTEFQGNDSLDGGSGDDTLLGGHGNDTLIGGVGVDLLKGGAGDDLFVFRTGDSIHEPSHLQLNDVVQDSEGANVIRFEGVNADDVSVQPVSDTHLRISWGETNRVLVFGGLSNSLHRYEFADGVTLSNSELIGRLGDQAVMGVTSEGTRIVMGGRLSDQLVANQAGDTVSGGLGNDLLEGSGEGSHVYLYRRGDGADSLIDTSQKVDALGNPTPNRLVFGEGIALADVRLTGHQGSLRLRVGEGSADSITFAGFDASGSAPSPIDEFEFADGTVLSIAQMLARGFDGDASAEDIIASAGNDRIEGNGGNDTLRGSIGDDTLRGGAGDDVLMGGEGADSYRYGVGDGLDRIDGDIGAPAVDTLVFGPGITADDIHLSHSGGNLVVQVGVSASNQIRIAGFNASQAATASLVGSYVFASGSSFSHAALVQRGFGFSGTGGDDVLTGTDLNDRFLASAGSDTLRGGSGSDDYHWNLEAGNDRIEDAGGAALGLDRLVLGADIAVADTRVSRVGDDLVVWVVGKTHQVRVANHFLSQGLEQVVFADATVWDTTQIEAVLVALQITGTSGDDLLVGSDNDDTLVGGLGNDTLRGGLGADDYHWAPAAGADRIEDTASSTQGNDRLVIDPTVAAADLRLVRVGADLEIHVQGQPGVVMVAQQFAGQGLEHIVFGDGSTWDRNGIQARAVIMLTSGNDFHWGDANNEHVLGGAGDDALYGLGGNDTLNGGDGLDVLKGTDGDDWLVDGETMEGGTGHDTYVLNGWPETDVYIEDDATNGIDRLKLSVTSEEVRFGRVWGDGGVANDEDLILVHKVLGESAGLIVLRKQFLFGDHRHRIEYLEFSDGVIWDWQTLYEKSLRASSVEIVGYDFDDHIVMDGTRSMGTALAGNDTLLGASIAETLNGGHGNDFVAGGNGNDQLVGWYGNDTLTGGSGRDTLSGQFDDDVYRIGLGDGKDEIIEASGYDVLEFGAGILAQDVQLHRDLNDLVISVQEGSIQTRIKDRFTYEATKIELIRFADGTQWDEAAIAQHTVSTAADTLNGSAADDQFFVDNNGDVVSEAPNQGIDTVHSAISYTLADNVENLTLTGVIDLKGTGNALDNVITGNAGDNILSGGDGMNTLLGGQGDDRYHIHASYDVVVEQAGEGVDTVYADQSYSLPDHIENFVTTAVNPGYRTIQVTGNALDNVIEFTQSIFWGSTVDGGAGADTVITRVGSLTIHVDDEDDRIVALSGGSGITVISSVSWAIDAQGAISRVRLIGNGTVATGSIWWDSLESVGVGNTLVGYGGNDTYTVNWDAIGGQYSAQVIESADGGTADRVLIGGGVGHHQLSSFANIEQIELLNSAGASSLSGSDRADVLVGNQSSNFIDGGAGDDQIFAGPGGYDTLIGGLGNDLISGTSSVLIDGGQGDDTFELSRAGDSGAILLGQGSGNDRLRIGYWTTTGVVRFSGPVAANDLVVTREGSDLLIQYSASDSLRLESAYASSEDNNPVSQLVRIEFEDGSTIPFQTLLRRMQAGNTNAASESADVYFGSAAADQHQALGGADELWGWAGDDSLDGGSGDDTIDGGSGADQLVGDAGIDLLLGGLGNDVLLGGSDDDSLSGGEGDDVLRGGAGNDWIQHDAGHDLIHFQRGDGHDILERQYDATGVPDRKSLVLGPGIQEQDVRVLRSGGDLIIQIDDGVDSFLVRSYMYVDYDLEVVFDNGVVWNSQDLDAFALTLEGDAGNNQLYGDVFSELLLGHGGNDTLYGSDGYDTLDGGSGADTMEGGWDDDVYYVDNALDLVTEYTDAGHDRVYASITHTLRSNVEELWLQGSGNINGTGNSMANRLVGNGGNNVLSGGTGADTLEGGAGDDSYVVDHALDVVVEAAEAGVDLVQSSVSHVLSAHVENLTLTGSASNSATGNDLANRLVGNNGANTLSGGLGDDTLDGGSGNDQMHGGAGNDTYTVAQTGDTTVESANEGTDLVNASITWTLSDHVEHLTLTGSSAINGTGNALDNLLTGNSGNNSLVGNAGNDTLDGGAGVDSMRGGLGNDTYVVERTTDVVTENASEGNDTVRTSVTLTLGANVENIVLLGTSGIHGTGNTLDNQLTGNSGANSLSGAAGHDTLRGMAGNDTLIGGAGNDTYLLGRGDGAETVQENDSTAGNTDILRLLEDVTIEQVWFQRVSNNLEVSIIGTGDKASITNWYSGNQYKLEQFMTNDGQILLSSQVDNLVNAMASFAPPAAGQTTLPPDYAQSLTPVIASNWN
ncbi:calcium-binding protein [Hydrogenophaga sp.]|uniref:calcium-binding protein n=1 Tax=Hydrogenophaga sp. TaxID=1904254 RepID=UPI00257C03A6|nr:calcium-binding protein [Hydrogenophaga sp.]